jgi:hypothetical protein
MTVPDLSNASAEELRTLVAAANARLEVIKQGLIDEAAAHGLKLVDGNGKQRRLRGSSKHSEGRDVQDP